MIVLGVDPGTASLGYGIVERTGSRLREVDHGCLVTSPDLSLPERHAAPGKKVHMAVLDAREPAETTVGHLHALDRPGEWASACLIHPDN